MFENIVYDAIHKDEPKCKIWENSKTESNIFIRRLVRAQMVSFIKIVLGRKIRHHFPSYVMEVCLNKVNWVPGDNLDKIHLHIPIRSRKQLGPYKMM